MTDERKYGPWFFTIIGTLVALAFLVPMLMYASNACVQRLDQDKGGFPTLMCEVSGLPHGKLQ